jgi:heme exporter protein D
MYWNSLSDFLAMGNHGLYVWGSFIVMALVMILEPLLLVRGRKQLVNRLRRQLRAEKLETNACAEDTL